MTHPIESDSLDDNDYGYDIPEFQEAYRKHHKGVSAPIPFIVELLAMQAATFAETQSRHDTEIAKAETAARIDENWKTREYVTTHHYDLTAGRKTDEYLDARIKQLSGEDA